jgi:hypothetical protein
MTTRGGIAIVIVSLLALLLCQAVYAEAADIAIDIDGPVSPLAPGSTFTQNVTIMPYDLSQPDMSDIVLLVAYPPGVTMQSYELRGFADNPDLACAMPGTDQVICTANGLTVQNDLTVTGQVYGQPGQVFALEVRLLVNDDEYIFVNNLEIGGSAGWLPVVWR